MSHIIAATTLAIPAMIISETSLSFLGLGLRPPAISWGVLLQEAQNIQALALSPWLLMPSHRRSSSPILAFNFLGDGLRDAADPYRLEPMMQKTQQPLLSVRNLKTYFFQDEGTVKAVDGASLRRPSGQDAGHRRRERLRQERDRALDPADRRAARADRRRRDRARLAPTARRPTSSSSSPTARRCARSAAARSA